MIEIGLRATKIRNPDNLVVVVPNNEIMQRDIINYTMSGEHIRLRIPFSCTYDSDIEKAELLLREAAAEVLGGGGYCRRSVNVGRWAVRCSRIVCEGCMTLLSYISPQGIGTESRTRSPRGQC